MRTVAIDLGRHRRQARRVRVRPPHRSATSSPTVDGQIGLDEVAAACRLAPRPASVPTAIGIAVPGVVDPQGSSLLAAHGKYAELHDLDLSALVRSRASDAPPSSRTTPVRHSSARSPTASRADRGMRVLIVLGTGIGTAAIVDGQVIRGRRGHGAILGGHITARPRRPAVPVRQHRLRRGAREHVGAGGGCRIRPTSLSAPQLAARLAEQGTIGIRDLVETRDEPESAAILDRYLRTWAAVIVTQCHAFDPDVVIVTGGVMRSADVILPALKDRVHADLWSSSFRPPLRHPRRPRHLGPSRTGSTRRRSRQQRTAMTTVDPHGRPARGLHARRPQQLREAADRAAARGQRGARR